MYIYIYIYISVVYYYCVTMLYYIRYVICCIARLSLALVGVPTPRT